MTRILPEDLAEFAWIAASHRPLIVCDVDEVTLEFVAPFQAFLERNGHVLTPNSFRLHGNIASRLTGDPIARDGVRELIERFFLEQHDWQRPVRGAVETLRDLAPLADIIFLTAMAPRHFDIRRRLLDSHGLTYPMIATEDPKGTVLQLIHGERDTKVVFIDDIFTNLHSVRDSLPNALLVNLIANATFRTLAPDPGEGIARPEGWAEADALIRGFLLGEHEPKAT
jgi:hypothetical protein